MVSTNGWAIGDWAYKGYELVQVKEMDGTEVRSVTTGFIVSSSNHYEQWLFPQTLANKQIAETIEIYWDRLRNARGGCTLNHPDINRKFEDFAYRAMTAEGDERKAILEAALNFQRECSEKLQDLTLARVDDVYIFNRNMPW